MALEGTATARFVHGRMSESDEVEYVRAMLGDDRALAEADADWSEMLEGYLAGEGTPEERTNLARVLRVSPEAKDEAQLISGLQRIAQREGLAEAASESASRGWVDPHLDGAPQDRSGESTWQLVKHALARVLRLFRQVS